MSSSIDEQFIRELLKDINERNDLPRDARQIWPDASEKILDHLQAMIDRQLIRGVQIPLRGENALSALTRSLGKVKNF